MLRWGCWYGIQNREQRVVGFSRRTRIVLFSFVSSISIGLRRECSVYRLVNERRGKDVCYSFRYWSFSNREIIRRKRYQKGIYFTLVYVAGWRGEGGGADIGINKLLDQLSVSYEGRVWVWFCGRVTVRFRGQIKCGRRKEVEIIQMW